MADNAMKQNAILVMLINAVGVNTHHIKVLEWDDPVSNMVAAITMIFPVQEDRDAPRFMPYLVGTTDDDGEYRLLWERDFGYGFPYLCDVDDEVVIAVLQDDELIEVCAIRDMLLCNARETIKMIELKKKTARVMEVERLRLTQHEKEVEAWIPEVEKQKVMPGSENSPVPQEPVLRSAVIMGSAAQTAVPLPSLEARKPALSSSPQGDTREVMRTKERARLASARQVKVYEVESGKPLFGVRVSMREWELLGDGVLGVIYAKDKPVEHFKVEVEGGRRPRRKEVVLVTAELSTSRPLNGSDDSVAH